MKEKGIRIVRYADDILIFATDEREARANRRIATDILEQELKVVVNQEKTQVTSVHRGVSYLGFVIYPTAVIIDPKRVKRFKDRIRELTPRNHGKNIRMMIKDLNPVLRGWANHFRIANCKGLFSELMKWIRRRLRMKKMKEWKSYKAFHKQLRCQGHKGDFPRMSMTRWRNSASPHISIALPNKWFDALGLIDMAKYEVGVLHRYYEE